MEIKVVKFSEVSPYYNNPRDNSMAVPPVKESIRRYGFIKPIVCDKNGVIIAGHTRYIAAFQLGLEYLPVVYSDMDDEKAKLFRIADNKLAEKSSFNENQLIEELRKLEVPEDMQVFFFEDVKSMLDFSYNDFVQPSYDYSSTYSYENEQEEINDEPVYKVDDSSDVNQENYVNHEETYETSNVGKAEVRSEFDDLYKEKIIEGKRMMKVVCPYCGNIETIEIG